MFKIAQRREQGQSLVEFALLLPLLLILLLGVLDLGRVFYVLVALKDAADEGATYAAIRPLDTQGIQLRTADASGSLVTIDPAQVTVVRPATVVPGAPITVTVEHSFEFFNPFIAPVLTSAANNSMVLHTNSTHPIISVR